MALPAVSTVVMLFGLGLLGFLEISVRDGCWAIQLEAFRAPNYASGGQEIKLDACTARRTIRRLLDHVSSGELRRAPGALSGAPTPPVPTDASLNAPSEKFDGDCLRIGKRNDAWRRGLKVVFFLDGQHAEINPTNWHC